MHDSQRLSALLDVDTTANLEACASPARGRAHTRLRHGFIRGEASEAGVQWFVRGEPDLGTFGAPTRAAASPGLVRPNHLELPPNDPSRGPVLYPSGLVGASGSPDLSYGAAPWGPSPTMMVAQPMPPPPSHLDGLEQRVLGLDGQIRAMSDLCARIQQTRDATRMLQSEVALHSLAVLDDIVGSDAHEQRQLSPWSTHAARTDPRSHAAPSSGARPRPDRRRYSLARVSTVGTVRIRSTTHAASTGARATAAGARGAARATHSVRSESIRQQGQCRAGRGGERVRRLGRRADGRAG